MEQANHPDRPTSVLVVEDEDMILDMVSEALTEEGFEVHAFANANEALRYLLAGSTVDVLFTDINLPDMDGLALAVRARQIRPSLPVVYASGRISALRAEERVPESEFVPKPYNPIQICRALARAVHH
ncbi:MAG: response regulator [Pseudorhodoplanes sp.]